MKITFSSKTIEVTKTFANKASRFGSEEYKMLRTAINDLPGFEVVIKATPVRRRTTISGLTYEAMEAEHFLHLALSSVPVSRRGCRGCSLALPPMQKGHEDTGRDD